MNGLVALLVFLGSAGATASDFKKLLEQTTNSAVEKDYEYQRLKEDLAIGRAGLTQRQLEFAPTLSFSSSIDENDSFTSNSLDANWNLFRGFQDYYRLKSARRDVRAKELLAQVQKRRVQFEAAEKVFFWVDLLLRRRVQEQELALRKNSLEIMQKRFRRGLVAEDEVLKMKVDWLGSQVDLEGLDRRVEIERKAFRDIFGVDIDQYKVSELPEPTFGVMKSSQQTLRNAENLSPEILAERFELERATFNWKEERASVYAPSLAATYSYSNSVSASNPYRYTGEAGLTLTVPLFSQWEDKANEQRARARMNRAQADLDEKKRDVLLLLKQSLGEMEKIRSSYQLQKEAVELAEKFYQQSVDRFRLGVGNSNDMAFDLQRFSRAKRQLSRVKKDYFDKAVQINLSAGRRVIEVF